MSASTHRHSFTLDTLGNWTAFVNDGTSTNHIHNSPRCLATDVFASRLH